MGGQGRIAQAEAYGLVGGPESHRLVALPGHGALGPYGETGGGHGTHEQRGQGPDQEAQPAQAAAVPPVLLLGRRLARVEEGAFPGGQHLGREVLRGGEAYPAVQGVGIVVQGLPERGGLGERAVQALLGAVLLQPAAEPGPAADQRLVGDLHMVAVGGQ